jgi:hypothetical protein
MAIDPIDETSEDTAPEDGASRGSASQATASGVSLRREGVENPERRELLGAAAKLSVASLVASVLPFIVEEAEAGRPRPRPNWPLIFQTARAEIAAGVSLFVAESRVSGGIVNGSAVFLPPGSLSGPSFAVEVSAAIPAPLAIANAIGHTSWEVWNAWSQSWTGSFCDAVPDFAAVPAPEAPEVLLQPRPLHDGFAPGQVGIATEIFRDALFELLAGYLGDPVAVAEIESFAAWYASSWQSFYEGAALVNVLGKGPIPSFAPPYVPVGPVVMGDAIGGPPVLVSPGPFGGDPAGQA